MNWIKSNPFVAGLAGITVLLCGVLFALSSSWGASYQEAKSDFEKAHELVAASEKLALYPDDDLSAGKRKALVDYGQDIQDMSNLFEPFRVAKTVNVPPQVFTDRLKSAQQEVSAAFGEADCILPEGFFLGFEGYSNQLARSEATGTLLLQLDGIKQALIGLAKARPDELIKVYREPIIEENGESYQPAPDDVVRYFPFEISFRGSESSVRDFLNSLGSKQSNYFIVRCLKIQNEITTPPRVADAKFETAATLEKEAVDPEKSIADVFEKEVVAEAKSPPAAASGEAVPVEAVPGGSADEKALPETASVKAVDSSRILAQVLGNEDVIVFVRFDLAKFFPAKELPKP